MGDKAVSRSGREKKASEMTDEELEARIREPDTALGRRVLELNPVAVREVTIGSQSEYSGA